MCGDSSLIRPFRFRGSSVFGLPFVSEGPLRANTLYYLAYLRFDTSGCSRRAVGGAQKRDKSTWSGKEEGLGVNHKGNAIFVFLSFSTVRLQDG